MKRSPWLALWAAALLAACAREDAKTEANPEKVSAEHGPRGEALVHIPRAAQERLGIAVAALAPRSLRPQVLAYGRVVADPSQMFELHAPIAGTIRSAADWPAVGSTVQDGARIGSIEPRLSAVERADLSARLAAAKGDEATARAALDVSKAALERAKTLNADGKNVSDRALEEAQGRVQEETARLTAATDSRRGLEATLDPATFATAAIPLAFPHGGEVLEIGARPGESVEAGALIARIGRFDPVLARVELPIGLSLAKSERATIVAAAHPDRQLDGQRVALAPTSETQGQALLFRVAAGDTAIRPGEAVTAWLDRDGPELAGVAVPRSALVRHAGKTWVYVATGDDAFERREIALDHTLPEGWFTDAAWTKDARVVVGGAQSVLSAEILSASAGAGEEE
jgi:hypothetical protein